MDNHAGQQQFIISLVKTYFLTVHDVAERHGVSLKYAHELIARCGVECVKLGPRTVLVPVWELEKIKPRRKYTKPDSDNPAPASRRKRIKWEDLLSKRRRKELR